MKVVYGIIKKNKYKSIRSQSLVLKKAILTNILILVGLVSNSQTGIGTITPDISSQLEVFSNNKGVLLPKVTLSGETDKTSIQGGAPAVGLLVYNTGINPDFPTKGFMFWNGSKWRLLMDGNTLKAKIEGALIKNTAIITPNSYIAGEDYNGFLEVSYHGGNGGYYSEEEAYEHNGLYFKLQPGQAIGSGKLTFVITGQPKVSSPSSIGNVPIRFLGNNLGNIDVGGLNVTTAFQYTLHSSISSIAKGPTGSIGQFVNNGYGGTKLTWRKDDNKMIESITLPENGNYIFSFRLYGRTTGRSPYSAPFYISALKQGGAMITDRPTDVLLDILELTLVTTVGYSNYTYAANLTVSGKAGDRIYFKIAGANSSKLSWGLSNGTNGLNYGNLANRTSMFFWKL